MFSWPKSLPLHTAPPVPRNRSADVPTWERGRQRQSAAEVLVNCELRSLGAETARSVGSFPSQLEEGACPPEFPTQGRGQPCSAQDGGGCGSQAQPHHLGWELTCRTPRAARSRVAAAVPGPHLSSTGRLATAFVTQDPEPEPHGVGVGVEDSRCPAGGRQGWSRNPLLGTPGPGLSFQG